MRLSGGVSFEKNTSNKDSSFLTSDEEKGEGGVSIYNVERKSDGEERVTLDEDIYDE